MRALLNSVWLVFILSIATCSQPSSGQVVGIDHIPVAVRNLEGAGLAYQALGFVIKDGRPHSNGIRNKHIKFADGTEIELITSDSSEDALAREYRQMIVSGDGPAFVALFAPEIELASGSLTAAGLPHQSGKRSIMFSTDDPLRFVFLGPRNRSPTDLPEHFEHGNGAVALIGVWLALDHAGPFRGFADAFGLDIDSHRGLPQTINLPEGFIRILPADRRILPKRPIIGATIRVMEIEETLSVLSAAVDDSLVISETDQGRSIVLNPRHANGVWLEFLDDEKKD
jgi:hypothetical protein